MAEGALRGGGADLAVAVTGIAGPTGGTPEKPVGLVYFALARADGPTQVLERNLSPSRETFKYMASQIALDLIRRTLG
jgi:nicotinamide-nucleotide amidase